MFSRIIKHSSILTILILFLYSFNFLFLPFLLTEEVKAAETVTKDDVYRGIGIAILLILISKLGQSSEKDVEVFNPRENFDLDDIKDDEIEILARAVFAESRGEPFIGQVAVAAVILNRVESSNFPNSVRKVVFQKGQFSSVDDGQIYMKPNESAYRAAKKALDGKDPSKNALYFYNPRTAKTLWWLSSRDKTIEIGNHVFAK